MKLEVAEIFLSIVAVLLSIWEARLRYYVRPQLQAKRNKNLIGAARGNQKGKCGGLKGSSKKLGSAMNGCGGEDGGDVASPSVKFANEVGKGMSSATIAQKLEAGELALQDFFPKHYERLGHVVIIKLNSQLQPQLTLEALRPPAAPAAEKTTSPATPSCLASQLAVAFSTPSAKVTAIIVDDQGIAGELRQPVHELVWCSHGPLGSEGLAQAVEETQHCTSALKVLKTAAAPVAAEATTLGEGEEEQKVSKKKKKDRAPVYIECEGKRTAAVVGEETDDLSLRVRSPTFTTHVENGVRYSLDAMRVMFCSGNTTERMHFSKVQAPGEVLVDMFAGIGYFTLPLAMHSCCAHLYALEKNPDSCAYLRFNTHQNKCSDRVTVLCGDNRVVGSELIDKVDRISMGYIPSCEEFLPRAVALLKKTKSGIPVGTIHYHFLAEKSQIVARSVAHNHLIKQCGEDLVQHFSIEEIRTVKSFSPKKFHHVADIVFKPVLMKK